MKQTRGSILIFMLPAILLFMTIYIYPVIRTVAMSFFAVPTASTPINEWVFTGIDNYIRLLNTRLFIISMVNISRIWLFSGIATMLLALLMACILTTGIKGQKFFRAIVYMPNVIAAIALAYMWVLYVFNIHFGFFTTLFSALGWETMANFQWLSSDNIFLSMNIAHVFGSVGFYMLIFIAGIEKIPEDYFEAAVLEGANFFSKFIYITLPLIKGVIGTCLVLWTNATMGFFALAQVFSNVSTFTPMMYTYQILFGTEIAAYGVNAGIAAASAFVMTVVVVIAALTLRVVIRDKGYELQ